MIIINIDTVNRVIAIDGLRRVFNDADFERKHPRDADGRFGACGGADADHKNLAKIKWNDNIKSNVRLTRQEYGKVTHELNNNLSKEERTRFMLHKAIGNYIYVIQNNGFNNYAIIRKEKIS